MEMTNELSEDMTGNKWASLRIWHHSLLVVATLLRILKDIYLKRSSPSDLLLYRTSDLVAKVSFEKTIFDTLKAYCNAQQIYPVRALWNNIHEGANLLILSLWRERL